MSKISIICNKNLDGIKTTKGIEFTQRLGDIKIGILNLMPFKSESESQYFSVLGRYGINVEIEFLYVDGHTPKNTPREYLEKNYIPLSKIKTRNYDGIIITGAPLEEIAFEEVRYWNELEEIFNIDIPSIYICWASQGALYTHYGIDKHKLKDKLFGVYNHRVYKNKLIELETFYAPHSRNTYNKKEDILEAGLEIIAESEKAGVYMSATTDLKRIYISGHGEYQKERLDYEYKRDLKNIPENYYKNNNPDDEINFNWDPHWEQLYKNWLEILKKRG